MHEQQHIDREIVQNTLPAVVQIVALRQGFLGNLSSAWTGSGTIVHPQGVILTNCHVANPRAMGMPAPPADKLAIAITERSDEPPVLTYLVDIVAQAPELDLAVLRIVKNIKGGSVSRLKLPYVGLGDSDEMEIGDIMSIFGYPGIGGETVTFTSGSVSGFSRQSDVTPGRAWIKTDATIAGGNSGGTAVSSQGLLVGIPTQAAAGTGVSPVDARPVVDTNRDGRVDQRDTPMAIGGFINGLRPINLAKPLLSKAGMDVTTKRPATTHTQHKDEPKASTNTTTEEKPDPQPKRRKSGAGAGLKPLGKMPKREVKMTERTSKFTDLVFSARITRDGRPINPTSVLPSGAKQLYASFEFDHLRNRTKWSQTWSVDGKPIYQDETSWTDGPRGRKTIALSSREALPDGNYHLVLTARDEVLAEGQVTVGKRVDDTDTEVSGQVIDRETKSGLAEALVIALKPDVRANDFIREQKREMAYTSTRTDRHGRFTFPIQLPKGQAYSLVVVARGYRDMAIEGALRISPHSPEKAQIFPVPMIKD